MQHRGFDPNRSGPVEGISPLEVTSVLNPLPSPISDESVNQAHNCASFTFLLCTDKTSALRWN